MKSIKFLFPVAFMALLFTSCQSSENVRTTLVEFETVVLKDTIKNGSVKYGIWSGFDLSGKFIAANINFLNSYNATTKTWSGFACSSQKDILTPGVINQYSCAAGSGAFNTKQFALVRDSGIMVCDSNLYGTYSIKSAYGTYTIKSMMVTNSTHALMNMSLGGTIGGTLSKQFVLGDWFKLIVTGYLNNIETGKVEYYLADYREGKLFMSNTWEKVDLSSLGEVDKVKFTFDSSDKTGLTINTPAYACIDYIELTQKDPTK